MYAACLCGAAIIQCFLSCVWSVIPWSQPTSLDFRSLIVHLPHDDSSFWFRKPPFHNYQGMHFFPSQHKCFLGPDFWNWSLQGVVEDHSLLIAIKISGTGQEASGDGEPCAHLLAVSNLGTAAVGICPGLPRAACSSDGPDLLVCIYRGQTQHWISHFTLSLLNM